MSDCMNCENVATGKCYECWIMDMSEEEWTKLKALGYESNNRE